MDHHCPWTANCVSHTTFPHFLRFLLYTVLGLTFLETLLATRLSHLWSARNLPAYLGPSPFLVAHLFATTLINTITLFALALLLLRNIWCLAVNTTTIEGWEIERHRTLLRRARHFGGVLSAPDGTKVPIRRQEFPYDVGIWANVAQGMGSANPLAWLNPWGPTPSIESGLVFPTNGFEDEGTAWPPPDPDRSFKRPQGQGGAQGPGAAFTYGEAGLSARESVAAFRERQVADAVRRRRPFVERVEAQMARQREDEYEDADALSQGSLSDVEEFGNGQKPRKEEGEEAWRNSEGERLKDFGVDEDVEFYDEQEGEDDEDDDVPLGELLARRKAASAGVYT